MFELRAVRMTSNYLLNELRMVLSQLPYLEVLVERAGRGSQCADAFTKNIHSRFLLNLETII
jgi:hypothetical protein